MMFIYSTYLRAMYTRISQILHTIIIHVYIESNSNKRLGGFLGFFFYCIHVQHTFIA